MFAQYIISANNDLVVGGCHFQAFCMDVNPFRSNFFHIFGAKEKTGKKSKISRNIGFFG